MSGGDVRVKVTVDHMRDQIVEYIAIALGNRTEQIADAVRTAVDDFDFDTEVQRVCQAELRKFVQDAASVYFRKLLTSQEAHAAVLDTLTTTMKESS
jgi:DNA-directed RNA polymerase sigma subunit (sigma70/sigma32)